MLDAQNELQMMLNAMIQEGTCLWTINKQVYGLNLNQNLLQLNANTVDIQNIMYRFNNLPSGGVPFSSAGGTASNCFDQNLTDATTQTSPNGYISYNFLGATVVTMVGFYPNTTGTLNPLFEYSSDGVTWFTSIAATGTQTYNQNQWYWQDVPQPQSAQYYRIRETSGGTLNLTALVFGTSANEIQISRLNKDDYQNLPFKNQQGRPLQYWFDRQIIPQIWLWPASQFSFNTLVVWSRSVLQDVGSVTDTLNFPQRWLDTIIWTLASRLIYILPGADLTRAPALDLKASAARQLAWIEERDDSPLYYSPMISGYGPQASSGGGYR